MGLREKVALSITVIILIQAIYVTGTPESNTNKIENSKRNQKRSLTAASHPLALVNKYPHVQGLKTKRKQLSESSQEVFRKTFNFPDVEYPTASTPRPPYYLQESNIRQRNLVPQTSPSLTLPNPSSTFSLDSTSKNVKYNNKKIKKLAKFKTKSGSGVTNTLSKFGTSEKPCYKQVLFPEVEYPLSTMGTWKPKYWQEITNYGQKENNIIKEPNFLADTDVKLSNRLFKKKAGSPHAAPKFKSLKKKKNNTQTSGLAATESPMLLTPCTTTYLDTTTLCSDKKMDEITMSVPPVKKKNKKKKNVKKHFKNDTSKDDRSVCAITTPTYSVTSVLEKDVLRNTNTLDNVVTLTAEEPKGNRTIGELVTYSNIPNQTVSSIHVATSIPYISSDDAPSILSSKIQNGDKTPSVSCDNKVGSLSDAINTAVFDSTDNKDSCFEDNVINSNKSLAFDADEEFTTDAFPDFDENMLSVSTSTMSPMTLDIDEAWAHSVIIDPYKSLAYPDELEECYIAVP